MSALKNKLKLKTNLKKQIEQEGQKKNDTRLLNYYDLKDGERMRVLFIPDASNGELYRKWKVHGPNLNMRGLKGIRCHDEAQQSNCPICAQGFALLNEGKEPGNDYEAYKTEAKKFFARDYTLGQCIVLEAPFEVQQSPDHNQVKLFFLPWAVEEKIREAIIEGFVNEDDLCMTPFVIKNTKNGQHNTYKNSYFERKMVDDDTLAAFDDEVVEAYDLSTIDIVPAVPTREEAEEWLDKAIERYNRENGTAGDDTNDSTQAAEAKQEKSSEPKSYSSPEPEKVEETKETEAPVSSGGSSIRDRIAAARQKQS